MAVIPYFSAVALIDIGPLHGTVLLCAVSRNVNLLCVINCSNGVAATVESSSTEAVSASTCTIVPTWSASLALRLHGQPTRACIYLPVRKRAKNTPAGVLILCNAHAQSISIRGRHRNYPWLSQIRVWLAGPNYTSGLYSTLTHNVLSV